MSGEKKELSPLAKQLLGGSGHIEVFTQAEFDDALAVAKAEIMIQALSDKEHEGEVATALKNAAEAILNRIPSQRQ